MQVRSTQRSVLDELVVARIRESLKATRGNVRRTSRELRVSYRTMWKRINTLGLRDELEYFRRVHVLRTKP